MGEASGGALLTSWARQGLADLGAARAEIDALNVFPVADGDTGTNLYLTQEAACAAMEDAIAGDPALADDVAVVGSALAQGALLGARGNSGIILSQLTRGLVTELVASRGLPRAAAVASALRAAAAGAYEAVATPVEGTVLTVARVAAERATEVADLSPHDVEQVVRAAAAAARDALARTPDQLEALARAGVVDSGGRGLVVLYDALEEVVTGVRRPRTSAPLPVPRVEPEAGESGGAFEVMYLLDGDDDAVPALRSTLAALGDSVVVVGGGGLWNVHVHTDDVGAAIESALDAGRPRRIRVTALHPGREHVTLAGRGVVMVTHGAGIADLVRSAGGTPVPALPRQAPSTGELLDGIRRAGVQEVVVLPSDSDVRPVAEAAARAARDEGLQVAVIPTRSVVQSLAATAVHDPARSMAEDVIAMTRAAHATRYGAVTTAVREAITMAGTCRPGDVLGVVDGDIAEIGQDPTAVAILVVDRLLGAGGELLTVVTGDDADPGTVDELRRHVRRRHPGVEFAVHDGGQPHWPLIVGVE